MFFHYLSVLYSFGVVFPFLFLNLFRPLSIIQYDNVLLPYPAYSSNFPLDFPLNLLLNLLLMWSFRFVFSSFHCLPLSSSSHVSLHTSISTVPGFTLPKRFSVLNTLCSLCFSSLFFPFTFLLLFFSSFLPFSSLVLLDVAPVHTTRSRPLSVPTSTRSAVRLLLGLCFSVCAIFCTFCTFFPAVLAHSLANSLPGNFLLNRPLPMLNHKPR